MKCNQILVLFILLGLNSCSDKQTTADDGIYFQDFDNVKMWARDQGNISDKHARSGKYSARTGGEVEYSQTFEMDYKEALAFGCKGIQVSGWILKENNDAKGRLVLSIESPTGSEVYETADIKDVTTGSQKWEQANLFVRVPESVKEGSKIKVYFWSPEKSEVYLDDVLVQLHK